MKAIFLIVTGMIAGLMIAAGFAHAGKEFQPFQIIDRQYFLEKLPPVSRINYLEGLADATAFIRPEDAIGEGVSKCLRNAHVKRGIIFDAPVESFLKQAEPGTPVAAILLGILRKDCAEYLK